MAALNPCDATTDPGCLSTTRLSIIVYPAYDGTADDWSGGALPIAQHWALPRVSLLYQDLDPTAAAAGGDGRAGGVWYEVRGGGDPKVVVTFLRVSSAGLRCPTRSFVGFQSAG